MQAGRAGSFQFSDDAAGARRSLGVFSFQPHEVTPDTPIVIGLHGLDRKAAEFRDALAVPAAKHGLVILVPEFDAEAFPDFHAYNYGNVRPGGVDERVLPRELWSFGIVERLFAHVRGRLGLVRTQFGLYGNSAGSQFVLRHLALGAESAVGHAIASNSGIYMLPDLETPYPTGMGGLGLDDAALKSFFRRRLTILIGENDRDPTAFDLPRDGAALAQGPHRLARGLWFFDHCENLARKLGCRFAWNLEIVPGAGHIDTRLFERAIGLLAE
jgi:poly(3-hydroxybutyrate) depolymerase